jgi:hypothetical protein
MKLIFSAVRRKNTFGKNFLPEREGRLLRDKNE